MQVGGSSDHDTIILGDGNIDSVTVNGGSGYDTIIVGSGSSDSITLNVFSGKATGADTVITGTGSSDTVSVAPTLMLTHLASHFLQMARRSPP